MNTFFDVVTVTGFVALVTAFFQFTDRDHRTLAHFTLAGIVLAIANQLGNHGQTALALLLMVASIAYAFFVLSRK